MPPGPTEPTKTATIKDLYGEIFLPAGSPKGVVVVTHGYADHCGRYRELAHVVRDAGFAVQTYDCRGHGKSPGKRGAIDQFETYVEDLRAVIASARALAPAAPLVLIGHSHGALITLRALCGSRPPDAVAAIVSSPYLGLRMPVSAAKLLLARVMSRIAPNFAQANELNVEDFTHDKAKQAETAADPLCFKVATARWFTESNAAQKFVAAHADRITIPTTWLVGGDDPIADPSASRHVANHMRAAQYHDLKGLKHEVFNEVERDQVFAEVVKTLAACS